MRNFSVFFCGFFSLLSAFTASGNVVLTGKNVTLAFEDMDSTFVSGNCAGIKIHAVFISKASGETLAKYAGDPNAVIWLGPGFQNSAGSVMAIAFVSLLAVSALLATCLYLRRHHIRRERTRVQCLWEFHGMSKRLVNAMPSLIFSAVLEGDSTSSTCTICLEDYNIGEKLRILLCLHKFHSVCSRHGKRFVLFANVMQEVIPVIHQLRNLHHCCHPGRLLFIHLQHCLPLHIHR